MQPIKPITNNIIVNTRDNSNIYRNLAQCDSQEQYDNNYQILRNNYLEDKSLTALERDYYLQALQWQWQRGGLLGIPNFRQYGTHWFNSAGLCTGICESSFKVKSDGEPRVYYGMHKCQSAAEHGHDRCYWNAQDRYKWPFEGSPAREGELIRQCVFHFMERESMLQGDAKERLRERVAEL